MAELPPAAGPKARDSTPSRRGTNGQELLPGTPQTAPPPGAVARTNTSAGAQDSLLMSPPPKRATTCFKGPAGALMSPPPARTRSSRSKQATQDGELLHGVCILSQSGYSTTLPAFGITHCVTNVLYPCCTCRAPQCVHIQPSTSRSTTQHFQALQPCQGIRYRDSCQVC